MVECAARLGTDENIRIDIAQHRAVDTGKPLLFDFGAEPLLNRIVGARAEVEIDQLASALAQAAADIVARDDQILAALILAPHDDMCVRMAGVVMIDRDPVEIRPKEIGRAHSELQSLMRISYAVFCLKKKIK